MLVIVVTVEVTSVGKGASHKLSGGMFLAAFGSLHGQRLGLSGFEMAMAEGDQQDAELGKNVAASIISWTEFCWRRFDHHWLMPNCQTAFVQPSPAVITFPLGPTCLITLVRHRGQ